MAADPIQFTFALLTRSLRVTHENLKVRDPAFVEKVDRWFAEKAARDLGVTVATETPPQGITRPLPARPAAGPPPPMFVPFRLRSLELPNRVAVSPMSQYSAADGVPDDWHLVHLGTRALGGAG